MRRAVAFHWGPWRASGPARAWAISCNTVSLISASLASSACARPMRITRVLEVAVAEAPLGFEEGEGPLAKAVLVHQLPRHRGDAGEAFRAVACLFLPPWATHAAQPAVGDVPKGPAHAHPGLRRVELHDLAAPRRPVGAHERHPVAHPPLGARRIVARHHRGAAGEARGRQRHLRHLPEPVLVIDHRGKSPPFLPAEEVAVDRLPPMREAHGVADGERPIVPAIGHSMYPPKPRPGCCAPPGIRPATRQTARENLYKNDASWCASSAESRQVEERSAPAAVYIEASTLPSVAAIFAAFAPCLRVLPPATFRALKY